MLPLEKRPINTIVEANYIYASVLYYFGIEFYHYSEHTLEQVCLKKGLKLENVVSKLENFKNDTDDLELKKLPIDLIVEYLKHTHLIFIKKKLPFISNLIMNLSSTDAIAKDLQFVFPLFVEDFIHHIYEEEDTLFEYIIQLDKFRKGGKNISRLYYAMEKSDLAHFASEHEEHDDEMVGIRQITNNYAPNPSLDLHQRVVFSELKSLEHELKIHAAIENDILFPKAMVLEKQVKNIIQDKIKYN